MNTKLLVIIAIIIVSIILASIFGYIIYKQSMCNSIPGYLHNPRSNSIWDCLEYQDEIKVSTTQYEIPVYFYELWQSSGIVIYGTVGKEPVQDNPVTIKIEDSQGNLVEMSQIMPDESGIFIHGIAKHNSEEWIDVSSHTITATYSNPVSLEKNNNIYDKTKLNKDTIPLSSEQISQLSHDQIIDIIKEWNEIGGNSPFTIVSVIGIKDNYTLGEPMPFVVQKSGYGNPCHDQGAVIFNEDTQTRVSTGFYLDPCDVDSEEILEPFNYLAPYNQNMFAKMVPIMEPGNYVLVAGSDDNSKYKKRFKVSDSDYVHDYNITYELQKGSKDNTKSMMINLNSGKITIRDVDGRIHESSIDQDTLYRINSEIIEDGLITSPWSSYKNGDDCDTCNFGNMKIMVDDVAFHFLIFDDVSLSSNRLNPADTMAESPYFFSIVDCVASKNNFETFWISDSKILDGNDYKDCSSIGGKMNNEITPKYGKNDYEFWVNDKPKPGTPPDAGPLAGVHEHSSILVKIFGDKFDFSNSGYQIKNPYIHFEGNDGNTIHRHADNVSIGFLFDTMNLQLTDECLVFSDGRSFCSNDEYLLKFYINDKQIDSLKDYVLFQGDRVLISYGPESEDEINIQLEELNSQEILS